MQGEGARLACARAAVDFCGPFSFFPRGAPPPRPAGQLAARRPVAFPSAAELARWPHSTRPPACPRQTSFCPAASQPPLPAQPSTRSPSRSRAHHRRRRQLPPPRRPRTRPRDCLRRRRPPRPSSTPSTFHRSFGLPLCSVPPPTGLGAPPMPRAPLAEARSGSKAPAPLTRSSSSSSRRPSRCRPRASRLTGTPRTTAAGMAPSRSSGSTCRRPGPSARACRARAARATRRPDRARPRRPTASRRRSPQRERRRRPACSTSRRAASTCTGTHPRTSATPRRPGRPPPVPCRRRRSTRRLRSKWTSRTATLPARLRPCSLCVRALLPGPASSAEADLGPLLRSRSSPCRPTSRRPTSSSTSRRWRPTSSACASSATSRPRARSS